MRQLKFRYLWKGDWYYIDLYKDNTVPKFEAYESVNKTSPFCQFTGLLDSKGVEIYEGDVVSVETKNGKQNHSIEWVDFSNYVGYRMYGINRRWNAPLTKNRVYNGDIEVIGNIYKNPELLNPE